MNIATKNRAAEKGLFERAEAGRLDSVVIRFAGDSGDGMQLTGNQFTYSTALKGNDLATFPDFPAEIRAPAGTTFGVSAYQIHFGSRAVMTAGDAPDVLVAMNPAALKVNLSDLKAGGVVVADTGSFSDKNLKKAGYEDNPLTDGTLAPYQVIELDISKLTLEAVKPYGLSQKEALRCKNMWTLGLMLWMFGRKRQPVVDWLENKFANKDTVRDANIAALNAGHAFGETAEMGSDLNQFTVEKAEVPPGLYRTVTGGEALALGLAMGAHLAGIKAFFGSYPITPASPLLHHLARLKDYNVVTFQAEDEIAAICAAIGASYAGSIGITSSSGPGVALKTEALGLALSVELPLVVVNSQRGGPSTGLPTKTEQSDLYQAVFGRNGDAPLPVLAAATPADCFDTAIEAIRIAVQYMTPVVLLTDGYLANAAEPWLLPDIDNYDRFPAVFRTDPAGFHPFLRDEKTLARAWAVPGTPGLEHRIGGLEKDYDSGNISYDAANHQRMTNVRRDKILGIADHLPEQAVSLGEETGDVAVVAWGSTYGAVHQAVLNMREAGHKVSHIHLRHIWPLQRGLGDILKGFKKVLVPEMNDGQLITLLRSEYLVDAQGVNQVSGQPFKVAALEAAIEQALESGNE